MQTQNIKDSSFLKILNFAAIAIEIFAIIFTFQSDLKPDLITIGSMHLLSLSWSIIYHMFPTARENIIYRFLAHTFCTIVMMLTILNIYAFINSSEWSSLAYFIVFLIITGPACLVSITLILLLNFDTPAISQAVEFHQMIFVPVSSMQSFPNPAQKMV